VSDIDALVATVREYRPLIPSDAERVRFDAALDTLAAELREITALCHDADAETMLYVKRAQAAEAELERVKAEREMYRERYNRLSNEVTAVKAERDKTRERWLDDCRYYGGKITEREARLDKALAALREIAEDKNKPNSRGYRAGEAGIRQIARAAIAKIEGGE
jgi:chromosome segregation ATPase